MNIKVKGLPLDDVINCVGLEESISKDIVDLNREITNLNELLGNEDSMIWDAVSSTYKLSKKTIKGVNKGYSAGKKAYQHSKARWERVIKPMIIKTFKNMSGILTNMYVKFGKLDKRYKELGKEIDYVSNHMLFQIKKVPSGVFNYHNFNANLLKAYTDWISDYDKFYETVCKTFFNNEKSGNIAEVSRIIERKDVGGLTKINEDLTQGMEAMNQYGEVTMAWKALRNHTSFNLFRDVLKSGDPPAEVVKGSLSDFVKVSILGPEVTKEFKATEFSEFKSEIGHFLKIMSSILNNEVIDKTLKSGGNSLKKNSTDVQRNFKNMSHYADKNTNNEKEDEGSFENQLDSYIKSQTSLIAQTSSTYTSMVRGMLSAIFVLVNESESIVGAIKSGAPEIKK